MGNSQSKQSTVSPKQRTGVDSSIAAPSSVKTDTQTLHGRTFHDLKSSYFLPKDDEESDRLHEEHFLIKEGLGGNVLGQDLLTKKLQDGAMVLDIGCGPGTWLLDLATEYPSSLFHGLDIASVFPNQIRPPNVNFKVADARDQLPYDPDTFDLVQVRLMATAFQSHEWEIVYRNMYRVLKPGGYLQIIEPDLRLCCERDRLITDFSSKVAEFQMKRRQDPDITRKLTTILQQKNFDIVIDEHLQTPLGWSSTLHKIAGEDYIRAMKAAAPLLAREFELPVPDYVHMLNEISMRFASSQTYINCLICLAQKPSA
ncbi:hypothetical protein INT43_000083 [Umbelopsis isabellina]|uniref:Methyltransferase domain-containing protein n=1 Tax=Mortierella isabellina TaxID=91625 RepID=A0A8H7PF16_MORIS|nr:hypothetical protein INT43_000083 [Umbelopsis isabellina]